MIPSSLPLAELEFPIPSFHPLVWYRGCEVFLVVAKYAPAIRGDDCCQTASGPIRVPSMYDTYICDTNGTRTVDA